MSIRHREVAVAVIYDKASDKFVLCHNRRWGGYAFPMKHVENANPESLADAALSSLDDWDMPEKFPNATVAPLEYIVEAMMSDAVRQVTVYEYHVFDVDIQQQLPAQLHPDLRLFSFDELQNAVNVSSSTKEIARSFVEDRRVAVAVLARNGSGGNEYLVVHNRNHGYFFPSTRIKDSKAPAQCVMDAVRTDTGYYGPLRVIDQAPEVPDLKASSRFGTGTRRFYYHLCSLEATGVDLSQPGNAFELSLNEIAGAFGSSTLPYYRWMDEAQLRSDKHVSTSMSAVLLTALQLRME